jgi:hypothetical protein
VTKHDVAFTQETDAQGNRLERYRWVCMACQANGNDPHVHSTLADTRLCAEHHSVANPYFPHPADGDVSTEDDWQAQERWRQEWATLDARVRNLRCQG